MTLVQKVKPEDAIAVAMSPEGLSAIHSLDCAAAIWPREPLHSFQSWIDRLAPEQLPKARVILRPEHVRDAASQICDLCGTPDCAERGLLVDDVAALAHIFAELMRVQFVLMHFDVVATDTCRKFDTGAVAARLICTYRGTGTQYRLSSEADVAERIFTVPTGSPILLRGALCPKSPESGLLHRSPPIEGTGETRLVVSLDPVTDPAEDPGQGTIH